MRGADPGALRSEALAAERSGRHDLAAHRLQELENAGEATVADRLRHALNRLLAGDPAAAEAALTGAVAAGAAPGHADLVAAQIAIRTSNWARLAATARGRLQRAPNDEQAREHLSRALLEQGDLDAAAEAFRPLTNSTSPLSLERALIYGQLCLHAQRFDEARDMLSRAAQDPKSGRARTALARLATFEGRFEDAEALCREAIRLEPDNPRGYQQLSVVRRGDVDDAVRSALERFWSGPPGEAALEHAGIGFTLADIAFRRGEAEKALHLYQQANEMRRAAFVETGFEFSAEATRARFAKLLAAYEALPAPPRPSDDAPRPIFIVGPPRSGTTLFESIIGAHPDATACGEVSAGPRVLDDFERQLGAEGVGSVAEIVSRNAARWRETYLDASPGRHFRRTGVFTDKMPGNAIAAPLLKRLFPTARFIVTRRAPFDVAVSILRHQFPGAYDWAHGLDNIATFLELQDAFIARLIEQAPDDFAVIDYDELVERPDNGRRALAAAAGLSWDDACLDHTRRTGPVATFSSVQVRKSISAGTSDGGRLFRPLLADYADHLEARIAAARRGDAAH
ncbi:MAG: sulfotransferase [Pseudomonadota bacterium]